MRRKEITVEAQNLEQAFILVEQEIGPEYDIVDVKEKNNGYIAVRASQLELPSWQEIVLKLKSLGFDDAVMYNLLGEIQKSGRHICASPLDLVVERLGLHAVKKYDDTKCGILFTDNEKISEAEVSSYIFSQIERCDLTGKKVLLTNSKDRLNSILPRQLKDTLNLSVKEIKTKESWISAMPMIEDRLDFCGIFFGKMSKFTREMPSSSKRFCFYRLFKTENEVSGDYLEHDLKNNTEKNKNMSLFIMCDPKSSWGDQFKFSIKLKIPVSYFVLKNNSLEGVIRAEEHLLNLYKKLKCTEKYYFGDAG